MILLETTIELKTKIYFLKSSRFDSFYDMLLVVDRTLHSVFKITLYKLYETVRGKVTRMEKKKIINTTKKMSPNVYRFTEKGFTLIEIMVVVVIIALIALFAGPELVNFGPNMRVKATARDLHTNLQKAKVEAIKTNRSVLITFNPVDCATTLGGIYTINIDEDSDGTVNAGDIPLVMNDSSNDAAPDYDYDLPQNAALCENHPLPPPDTGLPAGATIFIFSPQGLWLDNAGSPLGGYTIFRVQNDRGRTYEISVSISGGIKTVKL